MKKVAKIFFIIGIVTAIVAGICFIFAKTNKSKYDKEKDKYDEISRNCSEAYSNYKELNDKYTELYSKYEKAEEEAKNLYYKYVYAKYGDENETGYLQKVEELKEKWNSKVQEKDDLEEEYKKYKEQADEQYEEYKKYDEEKEQARDTYNNAWRKYGRKYSNALTGAIWAGITAGASVVLGIALTILNKIREKNGRDIFYKVLLGIGIFIIIVGIIVGTIIMMVDDIDRGMIFAFICGSVSGTFIWGYVTYKILNGKEKSFLWGFLLGLIGVIIAICTKDKNKEKISNSNKYEDLMKLKTLKEDGIITEEEFNKEKERVLKD